MQKITGIIFLILLSCSGPDSTEARDKAEILAIMNAQQSAWSNSDLDAFMDGYWNNDSLRFYGANGVTMGWDNTLSNYKKRYPSKAHSGELEFKINAISKISAESYYVMGEYFLKRPIGDANGIFMIIFKKIEGQWKIIADTSC